MKKIFLTPSLFRWIGGKRRKATFLQKFVAPEFEIRHYWEPFAGGASVFFLLKPEKATLSDINFDLIECYKAIRDRPDLVYRYLRKWHGPFDEVRYLEARHQFNSAQIGFKKSALFIVLNKTCFNGIWRVNRGGRFNVPFGKPHPKLPSLEELHSYSEILHKTELVTSDFQESLRGAGEGDFVYLDPPYPALNGTSFFTHYTRDRFSPADQTRVANEVLRLTRIGCKVMVSNAGHELVRRLYKGFRIEPTLTTRYVAAGGVRHKVQDVTICNYDQTGLILPL